MTTTGTRNELGIMVALGAGWQALCAIGAHMEWGVEAR